MRVPAHVQDDAGAGVFEGQGESHGSLFADGGVFDYLNGVVKICCYAWVEWLGEDTHWSFLDAG